jgi:hypothetical protein
MADVDLDQAKLELYQAAVNYALTVNDSSMSCYVDACIRLEEAAEQFVKIKTGR